MTRETLFTVVPTLGPLSSVDLTFEDGTQIHLEGNVLKQWVQDHATVVAMIFGVQAMTKTPPPKGFEGVKKLYGDKE